LSGCRRGAAVLPGHPRRGRNGPNRQAA